MPFAELDALCMHLLSNTTPEICRRIIHISAVVLCYVLCYGEEISSTFAASNIFSA